MLKQQWALLFWFMMVKLDIADSFLDETFTYLIDWCEFTLSSCLESVQTQSTTPLWLVLKQASSTSLVNVSTTAAAAPLRAAGAPLSRSASPVRNERPPEAQMEIDWRQFDEMARDLKVDKFLGFAVQWNQLNQ
jgi:hypothetical protein